MGRAEHPNQHSGDQRRGKRFPIRERVQYSLIQNGSVIARGTGTTVNFSSTGIQFTTADMLPVGREIEFSVDWPAELDEKCGLRFVGRGRVVRSDVDRTAVKIAVYEFRTRAKGKEADPARVEPPSAPA